MAQKDKESMKTREYRDAKGEVHHHTKSYMEQHGGSSGSAGSSQARAGGGQSRARGSTQRSAGSGRSEARRSQPQRGSGEPAAAEDGRLGELFLMALKDIYTAEKQMLHAMPKLSRQSQSEQFR